MEGENNNICIYDYYYSLDEIAELFEGKMRGKIIHFANTKTLELTNDEAQFFLDVTGAKAISGYGAKFDNLKIEELFDNWSLKIDNLVVYCFGNLYLFSI